jgi:Flp pilus assembly pilin Flp
MQNPPSPQVPLAKRVLRQACGFLGDARGAVSVEYVMIASLVSLVLAAAIALSVPPTAARYESERARMSRAEP